MDDRTDVRYSPTSKAVAIWTELGTGNMEWFVYEPGKGGHYTNGKREGIDGWPQFYYDSE